MNNLAHFILAALGYCSPSAVWAQLDPSSAALLRQGSRASEEVQLDSSRYRLRREEKPEASKESESAVPALKVGRQPTTRKSPEAETSERRTNSSSPLRPGVESRKELAKEELAREELAKEEAAKEESAKEGPLHESNQSPRPAVQDMVLGGTPEEIENYRIRLHPEDTRRNILELSVAPGYFYLGSSSNYSFRQFSSSSPGAEVGARIWLTPFFGVVTSYFNSMDGTVGAGPASSDRVSFGLQWFDVGLRWRKFFGVSRRAPSLGVGVDYSEIQNKFPSNSTTRVNTKSTGVRLVFEAQVPRSNSFGLSFGAFLAPRLDNLEASSSSSVRSGGKASSSLAGIWIGGQSHFDRHHQIFWRLQHSVEKIFFQGPASTTDPLTTITPDGVDVTSGLSLIVLGYRWGS